MGIICLWRKYHKDIYVKWKNSVQKGDSVSPAWGTKRYHDLSSFGMPSEAATSNNNLTENELGIDLGVILQGQFLHYREKTRRNECCQPPIY
jgi:hypothetical protein